MIRLTAIVLLALNIASCGDRGIAEPAAQKRPAVSLRFGLASYLAPDEVQEIMRTGPP
jgi:hypothetical protein